MRSEAMRCDEREIRVRSCAFRKHFRVFYSDFRNRTFFDGLFSFLFCSLLFSPILFFDSIRIDAIRHLPRAACNSGGGCGPQCVAEFSCAHYIFGRFLVSGPSLSVSSLQSFSHWRPSPRLGLLLLLLLLCEERGENFIFFRLQYYINYCALSLLPLKLNSTSTSPSSCSAPSPRRYRINNFFSVFLVVKL